jgi:hypothetical protein
MFFISEKKLYLFDNGSVIELKGIAFASVDKFEKYF